MGRKSVLTQHGSFYTSDGVRLGYRVAGRANASPVLFCYGLLCGEYHFRYQWEALAAHHRVLMLDYRGHHISDHPETLSSLNFKTIAHDLREFLTHQNIRRPVSLVGHSMGVNVALEFYEYFADRVKSLVFIAGAPAFPASSRAVLKRFIRSHATMKLMDGLFPKLVSKFWSLQSMAPGAEAFAGLIGGFNPTLSKPDDIKRCVRAISGFSPSVFIQLLGEYLKHDRTKTLEKIQVPSLIISGERDRMVPDTLQKEMHQRIAQSEYLSIPDGSHCPQIDRPDDINAVLLKFLSQTRLAEQLLPR